MVLVTLFFCTNTCWHRWSQRVDFPQGETEHGPMFERHSDMTSCCFHAQPMGPMQPCPWADFRRKEHHRLQTQPLGGGPPIHQPEDAGQGAGPRACFTTVGRIWPLPCGSAYNSFSTVLKSYRFPKFGEFQLWSWGNVAVCCGFWKPPVLYHHISFRDMHSVQAQPKKPEWGEFSSLYCCIETNQILIWLPALERAAE